MRLIKSKTLFLYLEKAAYRSAKPHILAWIKEAENANWENAHELKHQFSNASILGAKRVVFNIKGNDYRLIVDIEYKFQIIFIVWFGTHQEYDQVNAKEVKYDL